jgi:hypothetical protein
MASPVGMLGGVIGDLGGALMDANKAADEEQVGMNRLYTTMQANVKGWDGNTDSVEAYISKQQELAFGDDQLRDSLNILVGQTHDMTEAQGLQTTAMDLARAKNIDLQTASKLVGKVDMDNLAALKKLGIEVTDHMTKEQALAAIRQQTAGQAEAYANTTEGAMTRLQTNMGNVVESIGHTILPKITEALGGVADFVASPAFQGLIEGAIGFVTTAFDNLGKIIDFLTPILQPVVVAFQGLITAISGGGDPMAAFGTLLGTIGTAISDLGGKVLAAVGEALPGILAKLGEWGAAFINWIGPQIPPMLAKLGELAGQLWGWLTGTALPTIVSKLAEWGGAFIAWIGPQIPPLLAKLAELGASLVGWIFGTALPTIIGKLGEWGKAFVDWIGPKIPGMLAELGALGNKLGDWLIQTALPTVISKLGEWGKAFVDWIGPKIIPMVTELGGLLLKVTDWIITTALPAIVTKLIEWGGAFLGFVTKDVLPTLGTELGKIITSITTWMGQQVQTLINSAATMAGHIVQGLLNGLSAGKQKVVDFITGIASGALDAIKHFFGISSPSTVMDEMGGFLMEGLVNGQDDGKRDVLTSWRGILGSMKAEIALAMDKNNESSMVAMWMGGFNHMYQFISNAWGPQLDIQFREWFARWTTYFDDFQQHLNNFPNSLSAPGGSGGGSVGGGGGGGSAGRAYGFAGGGQFVHGGHGSTPGTAGGEAPITVVVMMPDGSVLSQVVRGRQDSRQARPSVVLGALPT